MGLLSYKWYEYHGNNRDFKAHVFGDHYSREYSDTDHDYRPNHRDPHHRNTYDFKHRVRGHHYTRSYCDYYVLRSTDQHRGNSRDVKFQALIIHNYIQTYDDPAAAQMEAHCLQHQQR